ncbi:nucleotidyltransferase domain-containing protein [uncultured Fusobacterium sp.]|uniref:nucleotidyltransferase domain-containing protein n=1 Tax=uncultured Fusobacterium sp. TaxID=159267 RepID=UPI0027DCA7BE|nr:nucleotidyltransferase domain-containing protein [uncultured Fusobacterium sp.]
MTFLIKKEWLENFVKEMKKGFGSRIEFIGLQGSHGRGEASEESDIDIVVILDKVDIEDLKKYDEIISKMEDREKICGFISGKEELINWEKADVFQFYYDTEPLVGNIDFLVPTIKKSDVRRAILVGSCNIYHMCGHNILHEKDLELLFSLYKAASFVLQAKYYYETGRYIKKKADLLPKLSEQDGKILKIYMEIKKIENTSEGKFLNYSTELFNWSSLLIKEYKMLEED